MKILLLNVATSKFLNAAAKLALLGISCFVFSIEDWKWNVIDFISLMAYHLDPSRLPSQHLLDQSKSFSVFYWPIIGFLHIPLILSNVASFENMFLTHFVLLLEWAYITEKRYWKLPYFGSTQLYITNNNNAKFDPINYKGLKPTSLQFSCGLGFFYFVFEDKLLF